MMKQTTSIKLVQLLDSLMLAIALAVSAGSIGMAQDFDKGMAAYEAGDYLTTIQEWKPIAESGDAKLQYNLGIIYEAMQAFTEAALWYRLAADQGMSVAQSALGYKYLEGQGVVQSFVESLKWYRLAADQGSAEGQRRLGEAYALGNGVAQDFSEALKWSLKSAKQGHAAAQTGVGMAYAGGHGVDQDKILGYMWLTLSVDTFGADSEHANTATAWLTVLSNTMTTAEVSLGQEMARSCLERSYNQCDDVLEVSQERINRIATPTDQPMVDLQIPDWFTPIQEEEPVEPVATSEIPEWARPIESEDSISDQGFVQNSINSDQDVCYNVSSTASFALHARVNGVMEAMVRNITDVKFPLTDWPESSKLSHRVISQIYGLSMSDLETFKPVDREAMEAIEAGTFSRCLEEWR